MEEENTPTKEEIEALKTSAVAAEAARKELEQEKNNLVAEIKDLREKKQLTESEKEQLEKKLGDLTKVGEKKDNLSSNLSAEQIEQIASQILDKRMGEQEKQLAEQAREQAIAEFKKRHSEFSDNNDDGGVKFSALESELRNFNISNLKTVDDHLKVLEKAHRLIIPEREQSPDTSNVNDPAPSMDPTPGAVDAASKNLSPQELKLIQNSFGGDKKRYLEARAKQPDYIDSLLQFVR